jgi:ABC-type transport system involved in multi-copper enzyme maturation permease subunit
VTIVRREIAVALPPLALLWLMYFLRLVALVRDDRWAKSGAGTNEGLQALAAGFVTWWLTLAIIAAFFIGITAGAEEQETGTANFARRLPIPPLRILIEKLGGSLLAFTLWTFGTALMLLIADIFAPTAPWRIAREVADAFGRKWTDLPPDGSSPIALLPAILWCGWLYLCAFAIGSFVGRTLHTAVVSGLAAFLLVLLVNVLALRDFAPALKAGPHPALVIGGGALLLAATATQFLRAEAR